MTSKMPKAWRPQDMYAVEVMTRALLQVRQMEILFITKMMV